MKPSPSTAATDAVKPLTDADVEHARELPSNHSYTNAKWVATIDSLLASRGTRALTEEDFREVMKALEDLSFECFSPIAPCNPPSVATYNRTFEVLNKHRAARGWKVVPKSTPQGAEDKEQTDG